MKDQHAIAIPAEILRQVQEKIDEANDLLKPYMLSLTPDERRAIPKMGDKTLSFVGKAYELAGKNPNLCPPYMDMASFGIDFNDATGLFTLKNSTQQLLTGVDDTSMVAGSEAYQQALVFYNAVKYAASQNVPGAKAVYEDLKARFQKTRTKGEE